MKKAFCITATFKAGDGGSGMVVFADTEQQACDKYRYFRPDTTEVKAIEISRENAVKLLGFNPNPERLAFMSNGILLSEHPMAEKVIAYLELAEEMHKKATEMFIG